MSVDVRAPAYRSLADTLRTQITSGRLRPGDRLPTEPQLCRSAGVSRSTVREALRLLTSEHLVITVRGVAGGSFVAHPSPAQLADGLCTGIRLWQASALVDVEALLEVRAMVEVPATALAAQRRTERHLEAIAAALFDPWTASTEEMLVAHRAFHMAIAVASGNPLLELVTLPLHAVTDDVQTVANLGREFWAQVDAEHRQILEAVTAGRAEEARAAAEGHLRQVRRALSDAAVPRPGPAFDAGADRSGGALIRAEPMR